ncbi:hypothetical protein LWP59_24570 [Amycolatopsis acidiphila]|uniref:Secreted protein n=1 Tax=Amycolatopsis acidiphila TaxID=715473 RepID=A0A558ACA8_9PSEU|nr:hypothetical protein [Amycolatopsis acidiphila]TVT21902.1 hypothetical protein FNH06_15190 [Amycolatopsis acidiphila]UIJ57320.1 hypothetical protein LWP59_24570 [Amycolatopsis acidiphila]GHG84833.1 hypothetical protein GCM10017788_57270 [Amycolatopsis acidiphila]
MRKTLARGLAVTALASLALAGAAVPALAAEGDGGVAVVDEPDTGGLNNIYTFAPLGVPVLGLVRSVNAVPGKILPSLGS